MHIIFYNYTCKSYFYQYYLNNIYHICSRLKLRSPNLFRWSPTQPKVEWPKSKPVHYKFEVQLGTYMEMSYIQCNDRNVEWRPQSCWNCTRQMCCRISRTHQRALSCWDSEYSLKLWNISSYPHPLPTIKIIELKYA